MQNKNYEIVYAMCCRPWPVAKFCIIQKCGICNQIPIVNNQYTIQDYRLWKASQKYEG